MGIDQTTIARDLAEAPLTIHTVNITDIKIAVGRTPRTARMCEYTSSALWWTPVGNAGFKH